MDSQGAAPAPLTFAQEAIWLNERIGAVGPLYNIPFAWRISGALQVSALERSLSDLVLRHHGLRTSITVSAEHPTQVLTAGDIKFRVIDATLSKEVLSQIIEHENRTPIPLESSSLMRACLLRTAPNEHLLLLVFHHIIADGWSVAIFRRELSELYSHHSKATPLELPTLPLQYAQIATAQRNNPPEQLYRTQLAYWKGRLALAGNTEILPDRPRVRSNSTDGDTIAFALTPQLSSAIRGLCRRHATTPFMVLIAAFHCLVSRWSFNDKTSIATVTAGRSTRQTEQVIGLFINTLIIHLDLSSDPSFDAILEQTKRESLEAFAHQDVPFEQVANELQPQRARLQHAFSQISFVLQNTPERPLALGDLEVTAVNVKQLTAKYALSLFMRETPLGFTGAFVYATDLYSRATIERLIAHFTSLLEGILDGPGCRLSQLALLPKLEQAAAQQRRRPVEPTQLTEESIIDRFERIAKQCPNHVAIMSRESSLTYSELERKSSALAEAIQAASGDRPGPVGLLVDQSPQAIVAILGALKSGRSYVALDPALPLARMKAMLKSAKPALIVTSEVYANVSAELIDASHVQLIERTEISSTYAASKRSGDSLTYVLYTSGSTGDPKGVMQKDRNVLHYVEVLSERLSITESDRLAMFASYAFDAAVMDIFSALLNGACLCLCDLRKDGDGLRAWLEQCGITIWHSTPTVFRHFADDWDRGEVKSLRIVLFGGEQARWSDVQLARLRFGAHCSVINGYGPTEATVCLQFLIPPTIPVSETQASLCLPIGTPVARTRVSLLSPQGTPTEFSGELLIHSHHVALGYIDQPEQTQRAFPVVDGEMTYRTGDLVRFEPDGALVFLGRVDQQVKINGIRIEPEDVAVVLRAYKDVSEAVVIPIEEDGRTYLIACVMAVGATKPTTKNVRMYVQQQLPTYMWPAEYLVLDTLPLTLNGKVDRARLSAMARTQRESSSGGPTNWIEREFQQICQRVLHVSADLNATFFSLGGHSLQALRIIALVRECFATDLPARVFFEGQSLRQMAEYISAQSRERSESTTHSEEELFEGEL